MTQLPPVAGKPDRRISASWSSKRPSNPLRQVSDLGVHLAPRQFRQHLAAAFPVDQCGVRERHAAG
jgi:hypothetical protein